MANTFSKTTEVSSLPGNYIICPDESNMLNIFRDLFYKALEQGQQSSKLLPEVISAFITADDIAQAFSEEAFTLDDTFLAELADAGLDDSKTYSAVSPSQDNYQSMFASNKVAKFESEFYETTIVIDEVVAGGDTAVVVSALNKETDVYEFLCMISEISEVE